MNGNKVVLKLRVQRMGIDQSSRHGEIRYFHGKKIVEMGILDVDNKIFSNLLFAMESDQKLPFYIEDDIVVTIEKLKEDD